MKSTRLLPRRWFPEGVLAYTVFLRPTLVVAPAFHDNSPAEQDALLAHGLAQADLCRTTLLKFVAAALVFTALTYVPVNIHATVGDYSFYTGLFIGVQLPSDMFWFAETVWLSTLVAAAVAWGRRIVYRADRWIADMLGLQAMNHVLAVARRVRYQRRGLFGMYVNLFVPNETKRADAVSCFELLPA